MAKLVDTLQKALEMVHRVEPVGNTPLTYIVRSQNGDGLYLVDLRKETCTCPAYELGRTRPCKHLLAAALWQIKTAGALPPPKQKVG